MKPFFTLICSLFPLLLSGQKQYQQVIDSLESRLPTVTEDTIKIKLLDRISLNYINVDPDQGIKYGEMALALSSQLKWEQGVALANSALGLNYQYKSDYPKAYEYDMIALKKFEELGDKAHQAHTLNNLANVYQYEKNYPKVLEYDLKALQLFEQLNDSDGIRSNYVSLGIFYFSQQDFDKALEYDFKALSSARSSGLKSEVARNLGNIGDVYLHKNEYNKALEFDFESLNLFEELGDKYSIAIDLGNIGEAYASTAKDTIQILLSGGLLPAGRAAKLNNAIEYLTKAITASKEIDQPDNIIEFSQYLSDAYMLSGNYKAALESYKQYSVLNDSVYSITNAFNIKRSEHTHDLELKDKDLKIAMLAITKKQNEELFFIAGIVLLSLIVVVVLISNRKQVHTNKLLSKEKKRSDDLLLNILPAGIANELKDTGTSAAKYFDNVTVMFTDFVDFTKAGERMSPQQLVDELDTCFKAFDGIMRKYGIEKIKTVGDAYLAVCGLPIANTDHAETILNAAIEIRDYMNERKAKLGGNTFEVRIGVHTGSVVAGIVGLIKFAYDIWGDTVNVAARMEEHSEAGKINISQTTYEQVRDKFICTYRGEIEAKNKGKMKMYFAEVLS